MMLLGFVLLVLFSVLNEVGLNCLLYFSIYVCVLAQWLKSIKVDGYFAVSAVCAAVCIADFLANTTPCWLIITLALQAEQFPQIGLCFCIISFCLS